MPKLYCDMCASTKGKNIQLALYIKETTKHEATISDLIAHSDPKKFTVETADSEVEYAVEFICPVCKITAWDLSKDSVYDDDTETIVIPTLDQTRPLGYAKYSAPPYYVPPLPIPQLVRPSKKKGLQDA